MSRPAPGRWIREHPFEADGFLAALILGVTVLIWAAYRHGQVPDLGGHFRSIDAFGMVLILLQTVPLAWRRSRSVPALAVMVAAGIVFYAFNYLPVTGGVGPMIGLYSVAAHCDRRRSIASLAGVVIVGFAIIGLTGVNHHVTFSDVVAQTLIFAVAWTLGDNLRTRRAYTASLEERAARLEREQDDGARRAVNEERARIARELHDVVAHSVSVMVVQAGAARRVLRRDPDRAAEALSSIETTGRQALDELRRLLGMLHEYSDQPPSLTPQPQSRDLDALVAQAGARPTGSPVATATATETVVGGTARDWSACWNGWPSMAGSCALGRSRVAATRSRPGCRSRPSSRDEGTAMTDTTAGTTGTTGTAGIRLLIADDQALVRTGFRMILEAEPDLEVIGEAADGAVAVGLARQLRPDVVLMDIRMPTMDGVEATRRLAGPGSADGARVLILTTFDLDEYVIEALRAGASGFLLKDVPPEDLIDAIRVVAAGDALLAPSVTRRLLDRIARLTPRAEATTPPGLVQLTDRELEVLRQMARGLSNAEIATELSVSETTVKTHVGRVLMKLGLRDRVQAVVLAYESGLVQPGIL
jgi:DNA-binding NarL/FixJ family response regulator